MGYRYKTVRLKNMSFVSRCLWESGLFSDEKYFAFSGIPWYNING